MIGSLLAAQKAPHHTLTGRYMGQALSSFSGPWPSSGYSLEKISPPVKMPVSSSEFPRSWPDEAGAAP